MKATKEKTYRTTDQPTCQCENCGGSLQTIEHAHPKALKALLEKLSRSNTVTLPHTSGSKASRQPRLLHRLYFIDFEK